MRGRRREITEALLREARIIAHIESAETLGIGTAGLNARGPRDEDGTHTRLHLDDGSSLILREYATTSRTPAAQQGKETAVLRTLQGAGLPVPQILASISDDRPATLLSDAGGEPLEEVFLTVPKSSRSALWSEVGSVLRKLHDVDTSGVRFPQTTTRAWLDFLPYFIKSLKGVTRLRPDLAPAVDEFASLLKPLQHYLDQRPRAITVVSGGGNLPGMLVKRDRQRWRVASWLSLGYYVTISDPARDVIAIAVSHREWTGHPLPPSFYRSYGSRPDPICALVYEANLQVRRGAVYQRGPRRLHPRPGDFPPPHSSAIQALEEFPQTVQRLRSLLEAHQ
ncbi:MAG: phosphotransferase [Actinobacteria bacterium]|nr:phosphotransferase [Actinomycetota bacterium]